MSTLTYTRYELLRALRMKRSYLAPLILPLAIYLLMVMPHRNVTNLNGTGISLALYYMAGLAGFGAMAAVLSAAGRIASERAAGWNRQLRLTPLSVRAYFRSKVITAYAMALVAIALLYACGIALGVQLSAANWLRMTDLLLIALIPLVALGILLGHLLSTNSVAPVMIGITFLLAFLSGTWFPLGPGVLHDIAQYLPSYWLVQASHVALAGKLWPTKGWLVVAAWSVALIFLAAYAYRRDTQRV
jgi:ABC-2 type transport system permease protein